MLIWNVTFLKAIPTWKCNVFFFLISSALFTQTYCSTVIKKADARPLHHLNFPSRLRCFLLSQNSFVTSSECFVLFSFLAVFRNPLPSLNSFCCFKDQRKRKGLWFTRRRCCVRRQWGIQSGDSLTFCQTAQWWFSFSGFVMKQILWNFQCTKPRVFTVR